MSELYVPVSTRPGLNKELTASILKKAGAKRVYLVDLPRWPFEKGELYDRVLKNTKECLDFYKENGFEVGVWITTLGYGPMPEEYNRKKGAEFTRIRSLFGEVCEDAFCPTDDNFYEMIASWVRDICSLGAEMIMLDDEITLSQRPGMGCCCENHLKELRKRLGEEITVEELPEKIFKGEGGHYRKVWLDVMGDSIRDYARKLRGEIDKINPEIRLGFCTGFTSWDIEGVDAVELSKIMAGKTKPFLRFSGAPYWSVNSRFDRMTLQTVIETIRMQYSWCVGSGVEVFTEDDSWPHDRYHTSAAVNELYDIATRVSDDMNGLKYFFEYFSQPDYDPGYAEKHIENIPLYEKIDEKYTDKKSVGIRVYEEQRKVGAADLDVTKDGEWKIMQKMFFSHASCLLTSNAIPTTYEGEGVCGIAFGENIKYVPKDAFVRGMIIDLKAAKWLTENGIDVGLKSVRKTGDLLLESFDEKNDGVKAYDTGPFYIIETDEKAEILSYYKYVDVTRTEKYPSAYLYENEAGQRFLVYAFVGETQPYSSSVYWCYPRAKQITEAVKWLSRGKELPLTANGFPHLYCICKENETSVAAGYFNCCTDKAKSVKIALSRAIKNAEFINCEGKMLDDKTAEIENIDAFQFAGITGDYV